MLADLDLAGSDASRVGAIGDVPSGYDVGVAAWVNAVADGDRACVAG